MGGDENKNEGKNDSIVRQYVVVFSKRQSRFDFLFPFYQEQDPAEVAEVEVVEEEASVGGEEVAAVEEAVVEAMKK